MTTPDVSIIIINWKSKELVRQCLASIYRQNNTAACEILVVDNASFDGIAEMLATEFPEVVFLQSQSNLGFAGANNLAFALSRGRNILFLNPDTEIQDAAIEQLLSALESQPNAGMTGARLLNSDLSLQTTCVTSIPSLLNQFLDCRPLRKGFSRWRLWGMRALWEPGLCPLPVQAISGACMLGRRDVLESIGAFSTDYFMYVEDMDLCLKVARAGYAIYYVPAASIVHHGGGSSVQRESNFSNIAMRASLVRFFAIHRGAFYANLYRTSMVFASLTRLFLLLVTMPITAPRKGFGVAAQPIHKWWHILLWASGSVPSKAYLPSVKRPLEGTATLHPA